MTQCIAIVELPKNHTDDQYVFKVSQVDNIENCQPAQKDEFYDHQIFRVWYFKNAPTFYHHHNALQCAKAIQNDHKLRSSPRTTMPIMDIQYDTPLESVSTGQALEYILQFQHAQQLDKTRETKSTVNSTLKTAIYDCSACAQLTKDTNYICCIGCPGNECKPNVEFN